MDNGVIHEIPTGYPTIEEWARAVPPHDEPICEGWDTLFHIGCQLRPGHRGPHISLNAWHNTSG
jgi:hypothetical protein